jgi:hypothetical protein
MILALLRLCLLLFHIPFDVTHPFREKRTGGRYHTGIDINCPQGTPLYAPFDGVIECKDAGSDSYGWYITVTAGRKRAYLAHLSAFRVRTGARVKAGHLIALSGGLPNTPGAGNSTGDHLHYETRLDGRPVEPTPYVGSLFHAQMTPAPTGGAPDMVLYRIKGDGRVWAYLVAERAHVKGDSYERLAALGFAPTDPNKIFEVPAHDGWAHLPIKEA